jgi:hypothetical protein
VGKAVRLRERRSEETAAPTKAKSRGGAKKKPKAEPAGAV